MRSQVLAKLKRLEGNGEWRKDEGPAQSWKAKGSWRGLEEQCCWWKKNEESAF
jgi:hypothetical protein